MFCGNNETMNTARRNHAYNNFSRQNAYYAYENGGNMDVQEVTNGTTIYLPVNVEGALLHVGDCHAAGGLPLLEEK